MGLPTPQHRAFLDKPTMIGPAVVMTTDSTAAPTDGNVLEIAGAIGANTGQTERAAMARLNCTTAATQVRVAMESRVTVSSTSGTVTHAWAFEAFNLLNSTATISNLRGIVVQSQLAGNGIVTEYNGLRITDPIVSTGSIGTAYGILIDDMDVAGASYAIRTGLGTVAFNDNVGINTTAFAAGQDVLGFGITGITPSTADLTTGSFQMYATSSGVHVLGPNGTRTTIATP